MQLLPDRLIQQAEAELADFSTGWVELFRSECILCALTPCINSVFPLSGHWIACLRYNIRCFRIKMFKLRLQSCVLTQYFILFKVMLHFIWSSREEGSRRTGPKRITNKTFKHDLIREHFCPESRQIDFHEQWWFFNIKDNMTSLTIETPSSIN